MQILADSQYFHVKHLIPRIPFNTFFAQSVLEKKINGTVYVDNTQNPGSFLVVHPYGMLLLYGKTDNPTFKKEIIQYMLNNQSGKTLWLQVYPDEWSRQIEVMLGKNLVYYRGILHNTKNSGEALEQEIDALMKQKVIKSTRVNFQFNKKKYLEVPKAPLPPDLKIRKIDQALYDIIYGNVVPRYFWNSFDDFNKNGIGYSLMKDTTVLSTCFSAFAIGKYVELGIETNQKYRNMGYAETICPVMIDYCLENHYEPVWACRKENAGSMHLAQRLGFEITRELPYYSLVKKG